MSCKELCPSGKNELGKGVFPAEKEAELLAKGYVFACKVPGGRVSTLLVCKRPIADAVTEGQLDSPRYRQLGNSVSDPIPA